MFKKSTMAMEVLDKVCTYLCLKPVDEWTDLGEIIRLCRGYGLTDDKARAILDFLREYLLEVDETGRRARLIRGFYDFYRKNLVAIRL